MLSEDPALPAPPQPQGQYRAATATESLVFTAGMTPRIDGQLRYQGQVGGEVSVADAQTAAGIAVTNAVAAIVDLVGSPSSIQQTLRMTVYVNAATGFTQHSQVADGASNQLAELLGDRGRPARSAVGVSSLPSGACVEVELTCARSAH